MTRFTSSDEVFAYWRREYGFDDDDDINALALFVYGIVERDRIDWIDHITSETGASPGPEQISEWFASKPPQYFADVRKRGEEWYAGFARIMLRDEIETERQAAILETIGHIGRFWPNFWSGNLIGVTSNIGFTVLVLLFVAMTVTDFSFIAWAKRIFGPH